MASAVKRASPRVWLRVRNNGTDSTTTVPARLGDSMFEFVRSDYGKPSRFTKHSECRMVYVQETWRNEEPCIVVGPECSSATVDPASDESVLVFGRAINNAKMLSLECPTIGLRKLKWYDSHDRHGPFVRLGVAAAVLDHDGRVLLTRRAPHMRSFPSAWVMPGGGVDDGDASLADAVAREVLEETGVQLEMASVEPVGLWESCYPTSAEECVKEGTGVRAHYLVLFCLARTAKQVPKVTLQEEETDLAVWLTPEQMEAIIANPLGGQDIGGVPAAAASKVSAATTTVPLDTLAGIYPRGDAQCGIGQGNLFMLEELLEHTSNCSRFSSPSNRYNLGNASRY